MGFFGKLFNETLFVITIYTLITLPFVQAVGSSAIVPVPKSETVVVQGKLNDSKQNAQALNYVTEYAYGAGDNSQAWRKVAFEKSGTVVITLDFDSGSGYNVALYSGCSTTNYCEIYEFGNYKTCVANVFPGTYYFEVKALSGNGKYNLDIDLIEGEKLAKTDAPACSAPSQIRPILPPNNYQISDKTTFLWVGAGFNYYRLYVSKDALFSSTNTIQIGKDINSNRLQVTPYFKQLLSLESKDSDKTLYWKVVGYKGSAKEESAARLLRIKPPTAPVLSAPSNGTAIDSTQTFSWSKGDCTKFLLQIGADKEFSKKTYNDIGSWKDANSIAIKNYWKTIEKLNKKDSDKILWWRVTAKDAYNRQTQSEPKSFSINKQTLNPISAQPKVAFFAGSLTQEKRRIASKFITTDYTLQDQFISDMKEIDDNTYEITWKQDSVEFIAYAISQIKGRPSAASSGYATAAVTQTFVSTAPGCEAYYYTEEDGTYGYCAKICGTTSYRCGSTGDTVYNRNKFIDEVAWMCSACSFRQQITNEYITRCPDPYCINNLYHYQRYIPGTGGATIYPVCQIITGSQNCCYYTGRHAGCAPQACTETQCNAQNRYSDWYFYCSGNQIWKNRQYFEYDCGSGGCYLASSNYVDNTYVQTCPRDCQRAQCTTIACSSNSDCGTNDFTGTPYCQNGNIWQTFRQNTCNNPGTSSSSCTYTDTEKIKYSCTYGCQAGSTECNSTPGCSDDCTSAQTRCSGSYKQTCGNYDTDTCLEWPLSTTGSGNTYCTYGCASGQCNSAPSCTNDCSSGQTRCNGSYKQTCGNYDPDLCLEWPSSTSGSGNEYCSKGCSTGSCIGCATNSECGTNAFIDQPFCQGKDIYQNFREFTCNNAGTASSNCTSATSAKLKTSCSYSCQNAACVSAPTCSPKLGCKDSFNKGYQNSDCSWSSVSYCQYGCSNAACNSAPCSNDCTDGTTKCSGSSKQTCSDWDDDSCTEWGGSISCANGCSSGACVQQTTPQLGDLGYCSPSNKCQIGGGSCQTNSDCQAGLKCVEAAGAKYGYASNVNVCEGLNNYTGKFYCNAEGVYLGYETKKGGTLYFQGEYVNAFSDFIAVVGSYVCSNVTLFLSVGETYTVGMFAIAPLYVGKEIVYSYTFNPDVDLYPDKYFDQDYTDHADEVKHLFGGREPTPDEYKEKCKEIFNSKSNDIEKYYRKDAFGITITDYYAYDPVDKWFVVVSKGGGLVSLAWTIVNCHLARRDYVDGRLVREMWERIK